MKKAVSLIISLILALSVSVFFVGCAETPCSHTWNEGEITTAPSLTSEGVKVDGVKTFTCTSCQETKTESAPYLGFVNATEFDSAFAFANFANAIVMEDAVHNYTLSATSTANVGTPIEIVITAVAEDMNEKTVYTFADGKLRVSYEEEGGLSTTTTVNGVATDSSATSPALIVNYYSGDEISDEFEDSFFAEIAGDEFEFEDFEYDAINNVYSLKEPVVTDDGTYAEIALQFENGKIASYNVEIEYDNVLSDSISINGSSTISGSVTYGNVTAFNEMYHITVFKPDGTKINGLTEGWGYDPETESETVVTVQYCALDNDDNQLACTADVIILGQDGTIAIDKETVDRFLSANEGTKIKFQINGVNEDLYVGEDLYACIDAINPYSLNFYLESVPQA